MPGNRAWTLQPPGPVTHHPNYHKNRDQQYYQEGSHTLCYALRSSHTDCIYGLPVAWLSEWLRRLSNKPDVVIPVTTEFFLISCDSNQVPKWFGTHYNLEVPL